MSTSEAVTQSATVTTLKITNNIMSTVTGNDTETTTPRLPLMEPTSPFPFWSIALITLSVLVVTSMVFVMIVLLCRILKEKRNKRHIYSTRSRLPQGILHKSMLRQYCMLYACVHSFYRQYSFTRFCQSRKESRKSRVNFDLL